MARDRSRKPLRLKGNGYWRRRRKKALKVWKTRKAHGIIISEFRLRNVAKDSVIFDGNFIVVDEYGSVLPERLIVDGLTFQWDTDNGYFHRSGMADLYLEGADSILSLEDIWGDVEITPRPHLRELP